MTVSTIEPSGLGEVMDTVAAAAAAYDRPDVTTRLGDLRTTLVATNLRVLVVGDFKQGKSTFVNALLGHDVCSTDDVKTETLPVVISSAERASAHEPDADAGILERRVTSALLDDGVVIVDTPGTGGVTATGAATLANLPWADLVLFVTSATRELTAPELELLTAIDRGVGRIAVIVTKTDLVPQWRRIVELDTGHLQRYGIDAPVMPTSAALRMAAIEAKDPDINARSGYPSVVRFLRESINEGGGRRSMLAVHELRWLVDQLAGPFAAEERVLAESTLPSPVGPPAATEAARQRALKWSQVLNDGFVDLGAAADFDLRGRVRQLLKMADEHIDEVDPTSEWDDIVGRVTVQALEHVSDHHRMVTEHIAALTEAVARQFDNPVFLVDRGLAEAQLTGELVAPVSEKTKVTGATLTMLKGGYGGVAMFGMLASMAGLPMAMPIVLGAGVLMGRKALTDEKKRTLATRRQQAKAAVRRYLDDLSADVSREVRATTREAQRQLRDSAAAYCDDFLKSMAATAAATQRAAATQAADRDRRLADARAELQRLSALRARIDALA